MTLSTSQTPIGSGFGAASTSREVIQGIHLANRVAIVTGGYAGLGLETVRTLADAGCKVIVPTRDHHRAFKVLEEIHGVELQKMDLMDPDSIVDFTERFIETGRPLHILINCAGIMACPLARDPRGNESQLSTNHLGHFQLTTRLLPALFRAKGARVINVTSLGHRYSPVVEEDPNFERRNYDPWLAYGQSKTANSLFSVELDRRYQDQGIRSFAVHPGRVLTGLGRHVPRESLLAGGFIDEGGNPVLDPLNKMKTLEQGAATILWAATNPKLNGLGGVYCENCDIAPLMDGELGTRDLKNSTGLVGVMNHAVDPDAAERLWALSEKLISRNTN